MKEFVIDRVALFLASIALFFFFVWTLVVFLVGPILNPDPDDPMSRWSLRSLKFVLSIFRISMRCLAAIFYPPFDLSLST